MNDHEDEPKENDEMCSTQRDLEELRGKLKPPDRGKFDRELAKINTAIRDLEAKFKSLQSSQSHSVTSTHEGKDRDSLMSELRGYKAEREKEIETRKKIDLELKGVNITVQQKNDLCGRLQASLKYKTEARADEAIRRLEHQLRVQQLKLREEKRLVTEIDTLRRSKKRIHEFDALKQEISQLRDKQNALRKQRDNCMKAIAKLKSKEEEIKTLLDEQRSKDGEVKQQKIGYNIEKNSLKKEIDELYTRKRSLVSTYHKEKEEYYSLLKDIREHEKRIKREEDEMKRIQERHQRRKHYNSEGSEQHFINSAHEKMLDVCDSLILYINGLNISNKADQNGPMSDQPSTSQQNTDSNFSGGTFLKKKSDDDLEEMYGAVAARKVGKKGSRKGKKAAQKENAPKKLILHPLVLDQFISLHIAPPSTAADVPKVLGLLIEKKTSLYTVIDVEDPPPRSPSSTSSSSLENFPSLPSQKDQQQQKDTEKELQQQQNDEDEQQQQEQKDEEKKQQQQNQEKQQQHVDEDGQHQQNDKKEQQQQQQSLKENISATDQSKSQLQNTELKQNSNENGSCLETEEAVSNLKHKINSNEDSNISDIIPGNSILHARKNSLEENTNTNNHDGCASNTKEECQIINHSREENGDENIAADLEEISKDSGPNGDQISMVSLDNLTTNGNNNSAIKCPS